MSACPRCLDRLYRHVEYVLRCHRMGLLPTGTPFGFCQECRKGA